MIIKKTLSFDCLEDTNHGKMVNYSSVEGGFSLNCCDTVGCPRYAEQPSLEEEQKYIDMKNQPVVKSELELLKDRVAELEKKI